jgi:hypothetical protein
VIEKPHKKIETYSSVDTKVDGRKPSPYKMAGELFIQKVFEARGLLFVTTQQTKNNKRQTEN